MMVFSVLDQRSKEPVRYIRQGNMKIKSSTFEGEESFEAEVKRRAALRRWVTYEKMISSY